MPSEVEVIYFKIMLGFALYGMVRIIMDVLDWLK